MLLTSNARGSIENPVSLSSDGAINMNVWKKGIQCDVPALLCNQTIILPSLLMLFTRDQLATLFPILSHPSFP